MMPEFLTIKSYRKMARLAGTTDTINTLLFHTLYSNKIILVFPVNFVVDLTFIERDEKSSITNSSLMIMR